MSTSNHHGNTLLPPRLGPSISKSRLVSGLLWFTFAISGIVWIEPAPFDFMVIVLIGVGIASGLRLPQGLGLPLGLLGVLAVTGLVGAAISDTVVESIRHVGITIFLYAFTIGLTAFVARDAEQTLPIVFGGQTIAALVATLVGVFAYFFLTSDINTEVFTDQGRVRGTFKDPNVFGPFLTIPIVYWFLRQFSGQIRFVGLQTLVIAVLCFGLLLSFSRGAWGSLGLSLGVAMYLSFVTSRSIGARFKIMGLAIFFALLAVGGLVFAMSFDPISEMMDVRGKLLQSYDLDQRFVGARLAVELILENPLGFGTASFNNIHGNEPHNVYLYHFLIAGWIGGSAYISLVFYTLVISLRSALSDHPQQMFAILLFSTFLAIAIEGLIVDTDHWRHFYMLMACIWGLYFHQKESQNREELTISYKSKTVRRSSKMLTRVSRSRDALLPTVDYRRTQQSEATVTSENRVFGRRGLEQKPCRVIFGLRDRTTEQ